MALCEMDDEQKKNTRGKVNSLHCHAAKHFLMYSHRERYLDKRNFIQWKILLCYLIIINDGIIHFVVNVFLHNRTGKKLFPMTLCHPLSFILFYIIHETKESCKSKEWTNHWNRIIWLKKRPHFTQQQECYASILSFKLK